MTISAKRVLLFLGSLVFLFAAMHLVLQFTVAGFDASDRDGPAALFNLNNEISMPTWFSQMLLAIVAVLCLVIGKMAQKFRYAWYGLAGLMIFLSIDEGAAIHELFAPPLSQAFGITSGPLFYSWIIAYAALLIFLLLAYLRFFIALPRQLKIGLASAVGVFLLGAVGFEALGGSIAAVSGEAGVPYSLSVVAEETLEMLGSVLAIYVLVAYLAAGRKIVTLSFQKSSL